MVKLINEAKNYWKMWSVRMYALLFIAPDVYNIISSYGILDGAPVAFVWIVKVLAATGVALRLIKQKGVSDDTTNSIDKFSKEL